MDILTDWQCTQLTRGSEAGVYHSHSYYDVPVFDADSRYLAGQEVRFAGRQPTATDVMQVGYIDLDGAGEWTPVGESRAWSWQQGALTQWIPGRRTLIWNDRDGDRFVARTYDVEHDTSNVLPRPVYAVDPNGRFMLSLNMARLDAVRPGYGYVEGAGARLDERLPREDGIWRVDLSTGETELILSLETAVRFLRSRLTITDRLKHWFKHYIYWFNHVKISPNGERFTVKLRFRAHDLESGWNDQMGVSLTGTTDGTDLRLLARGTSHVIWLDADRLYLWQRDGVYLYGDEHPEGHRQRRLAGDLIDHNVHIRHFPGTTDRFVFDTPYREQVSVYVYDASAGQNMKIAQFGNHTPKRGLFRCDLHPVPSPDTKKIVVTSLDDGGRQIYMLTR